MIAIITDSVRVVIYLGTIVGMSQTILVHKYGGTSVGSTDRLNAVADRLIRCAADGHRMVVVVSAMGSTTDQLVELAQCMRAPDLSADAQVAIDREYDQLVATGEIVSASLLAMALQMPSSCG